MVNANRIPTGLKAVSFALAIAFGLTNWAPAVQAQQDKAKGAAGALDLSKPKADKKPLSIQWLKFCEFSITKKSDQKKTQVCLVHYEQRAADTGTVLVSAAIRQIEGQEKERFIIMVPLGVAIPPGLKIRVDKQEPISLRYTLCHPHGCTAEGDATKEFVEKLKKGNKLYVAAINAFGRGFALPVSLGGFTKTYQGPATDAKKVEQIRMEEWKTVQALYAAQKGKKPAADKKKTQ